MQDMLKEFRKYDQMPDGNILNLDDVLVEGSRETPFEYQVPPQLLHALLPTLNKVLLFC